VNRWATPSYQPIATSAAHHRPRLHPPILHPAGYKAATCTDEDDVEQCGDAWGTLPGNDRKASSLAILYNFDEYLASGFPFLSSVLVRHATAGFMRSGKWGLLLTRLAPSVPLTLFLSTHRPTAAPQA
jgi:hypothetical protein